MEIVSALIGDELDAMGAGVGAIFDGYPRTAPQAKSLEAILESRGRKLDHVVELDVNEDALVNGVRALSALALDYLANPLQSKQD